MALKSVRIVDSCGKLRRFADFENTVDRGSAVIFADSGLCLLNEIWIKKSFFSLDWYVNGSSKLFLFSKEAHLNSAVRLLLELYGVVIKHVVLFTIWAKLTMPFTCTSLPLNLYTSVFGCGCGSDLNKNVGGSMDLATKRHGSVDLHTPIHPPELAIST